MAEVVPADPVLGIRSHPVLRQGQSNPPWDPAEEADGVR